jgi:hypothetical protein
MKSLNSLQKHGYSSLKKLITLKKHHYTDEIFQQECDLNTSQIKQLYTYLTPKLSSDNSCSVGNELENNLYDLSSIFKKTSENDTWLWRLNLLILKLQK